MAVIAFTGVQGAGKSFTAVSDLYDLLQKDANAALVVIHNIDGLESEPFGHDGLRTFTEIGITNIAKLTYLDFDSICSEARERGSRTLWIIDEAQDHLQRFSSDWLQIITKHRKKGSDIWLITQDLSLIDRTLIYAFEWRADNPWLQVIPGHIRLKKRFKGEVIGTRTLKKRKSIYNLYHSFDGGGGESSPQSGHHMLIPLICCLLIVVVCGLLFRHSMAGTKESLVSKNGITNNIKPITPIAPPPIPAPLPKIVSRETIDEYTLSGCLGGKILLQTMTGSLSNSDDLFPDSKVLECNSKTASIVLSPSGKRTFRHKNGFVAVAQARPERQASGPGADGGVQSLINFPALSDVHK